MLRVVLAVIAGAVDAVLDVFGPVFFLRYCDTWTFIIIRGGGEFIVVSVLSVGVVDPLIVMA
jgi:hypothetical protein